MNLYTYYNYSKFKSNYVNINEINIFYNCLLLNLHLFNNNKRINCSF